MRAENDIEDEEIEVHMAELSPRGFPITTGHGRNQKNRQNRNKKSGNMERRNNGTGRIQL